MVENRQSREPVRPRKGPAPSREAARAEALRANLPRRKAQARAQTDSEAASEAEQDKSGRGPA